MTLAITTMIGASLTSVLMAIVTNARRDAQQADAYESLRLAAHQIMLDIRFARVASAGFAGSSLTLSTNASGTDYIMYTFARCNPGDPVIPKALYRWQVEGGTCTDEIVATNLVPPQAGDPHATEFAAIFMSGSRSAEANLVREPLPGQWEPIRITVFAHLR